MVSQMRREAGDGKTNAGREKSILSPHPGFPQVIMLNKKHKGGQQRRKIWQQIY